MARHIYVHIPFCVRKCDYCDFYSVADNSFVEGYFAALKEEIEKTEILPDSNPDEVDTVYFGGGTPSVPDASFITETLELILDRFSVSSDAEITIECNPNSVTYEKFLAYKNAGFNRVSLGIQSLHDDVLKTLGRLHDSTRAVKALEEAFNAGFTNVSADLMLGIPGQTLEGLLEDGQRLIDLNVTHVSMYSLIIEEGTPFHLRYRNIEDIVDPDLERNMYHELRDLLGRNGLVPYEISNCGKPSLHNMSYWNAMEYYAFGAGASGYVGGRRFSHAPDIRSYIDDPLCVDVEEIMTPDTRKSEYVMLRFRTADGVDADAYCALFGGDLDKDFGAELNKLISEGLIRKGGNSYSLTHKGLDFANLVFEEFI